MLHTNVGLIMDELSYKLSCLCHHLIFALVPRSLKALNQCLLRTLPPTGGARIFVKKM